MLTTQLSLLAAKHTFSHSGTYPLTEALETWCDELARELVVGS